MQRKSQIVDDQHAVIRLIEFECNGARQAEVFGLPVEIRQRVFK